MKRLRKITQPYRRALLTRVTAAAMSLIGSLPVERASTAGALLGRWVGVLAGGAQRRALKHLRFALGPAISDAQLQGIAARMWSSLGASLFEVLAHRRITPETVDRYIVHEGLENYRRHVANGKGTILVGAHLGNWELAGAFFPLHGLDFHVVVRENPNPGLDRVITGIREFWGMKISQRTPVSAAKEALRIIRKGGCLAVMIDQDIDAESIFVPFFGHPASTLSGPAALAQLTGAPVFLVLMERTSPGRHRLWIEGPMPMPASQDRAANICGATAAITARIEEEIRRRPWDWVWMHERWKRTPPPERSDGT